LTFEIKLITDCGYTMLNDVAKWSVIP